MLVPEGYVSIFEIKCSIRRAVLGGAFYSLAEAHVVVESWRQHCDTVRPHSSLGYRAPEA
jgi:putative transposase